MAPLRLLVLGSMVAGVAIQYVFRRFSSQGRLIKATKRGEFLQRVIRNLDLLAPQLAYSDLQERAKDEMERARLSATIFPNSRYQTVMKRSKKRPTLSESLMTCTDCAVCLDHFDDNPNASCRVLPCGHLFHTECIDEWVCRSATEHTDSTLFTPATGGSMAPQCPAPHCPLCKERLGVVDLRDSRDAYLRALLRRDHDHRLSRDASTYSLQYQYATASTPGWSQRQTLASSSDLMTSLLDPFSSGASLGEYVT
mmetsp:Transcript_10774/g.19479  ORF Transcript_10774/g.19479 Transcript_10774/m.19479 type:complete len:254 (+) Transcript_10774:201-962(+)